MSSEVYIVIEKSGSPLSAFSTKAKADSYIIKKTDLSNPRILRLEIDKEY